MRAFLKLVGIASVLALIRSENLDLVTTESRLPEAIYDSTAVYDGQDSIYVIGGIAQGAVYTNRVVKYSLSSGSVEVIGTLDTPLCCGAAIVVGNDVIHFGGSSRGSISSIYRISTITGEATIVSNLPVGEFGIAVAWDSISQVAYLFGGYIGYGSAGYHSDLVLRYNASNHQVNQVAQLPQGRYAPAAWDSQRGVAYVLGGRQGTTSLFDILEFQPPSGLVELPATLPGPGVWDPTAWFDDTMQEAYVINSRGMIRYNPGSSRAEKVTINNWPVNLQYFPTAYVPSLRRIYIFGGTKRHNNEEGFSDEISYIEFKLEEPTTTTTQLTTTTTTTERPPPADCSDGTTKIIPDPFCCRSFFVCQNGVPTAYECSYDTHFNPKTSQCEDPAVVRCGLTYVE